MPRQTALLLAAAALLGLRPAAAGVEVAVIANRAVAQDSLSRSQLLDLYTGDIQSWPDGTPVALKDLKARGEVRDGFYAYLGRRPSRMKSIWLRRMLSGEGEPPEALADEGEMLDRVEATPGAIGYVRRDRVTDGVRVLLVIAADGDGPGPPAP